MSRISPVLSRTIAWSATKALGLCVLLRFAHPAVAATSVDADAGLYIEYLSMKAGGVVCNERIPGYSSKFEPWFAVWQDKRSVQLARGPSALEQTQKRHGIDYAQLVSGVAQKLRKADTNVLNKECSTLLEVIEPYIAQ